MLKAFKDFMVRSDLFTVAAGLLMALATFSLLRVAVGSLIEPLITVFIGTAPFELNSFRIGSSEFRYGAMIGAAMTFALASAVAYFLVVMPYRGGPEGSEVVGERRACPECTSSISALAKRCPHCTAVVQLDSV
jgi:large conductance mechanosensitive channel